MKNYLLELKLLPLIVALLQYLMLQLGQKGKSEKSLSHQRDFWLSLLLLSTGGLLFQYGVGGYKFIALLILPWFFRAMTTIYEDLSLKNIKEKKMIPSLELMGGSLSVLAYFISKNPLIYISPFMICMAYYAQVFGRRVLDDIMKKQNSFSVSYTYVLMIICTVVHLMHPYFRDMEFIQTYLPISFVAIFVGLQFALQTSFSELIFIQLEKDSHIVINEKAELLLEQSKYTELGMLFAGITHEINNPLMVIQARATQLLRFHRDASKLKDVSEGLQQIVFMAERISRTIQGIREFISPDKKNDLEEISLKLIIDDVSSFCGQRFTNHGINLRFYNLEKFSLLVNKVQIEQVILNLLNNSFDAIEFLPEKWIELTAKETNDSIQIMIKDSGVGIKDDIAQKMMEPFYTTRPSGKGIGIGLSLAKGILEGFGGKLIYLKQEPHTTFMIELPKVQNQGRAEVHDTQFH